MQTVIARLTKLWTLGVEHFATPENQSFRMILN